MTTATISVPEFAGTRARAADLAEALDLSADNIVLDFTDCRSAAQGFCDELVHQIVDLGDAHVTEVIGATPHIRGYLELALRLRDLPYVTGLAAPESIQRLVIPASGTSKDVADALAESLAIPYLDVVLDFAGCAHPDELFLDALITALQPRLTLTVVNAGPHTRLAVDRAVRSGILKA